MKGKRILFAGLLAAVVPLILACGPAGSPPIPAVTAAPAGELVAQPGWKTEWEKVLAEARKEDRVVVIGPPGAELRQGLIDGFQKAYPGISLEYTSLSGQEAAPKIAAERRAGLFTTDLIMGGPRPLQVALKQYALPVEDLLVLPQVKDGKNWRHGKLMFTDKEGKYVLVFGIMLHPVLAYNTNLVSGQKMEGVSLWELTRPEWKGKFVWHDPRWGGFGTGVAWFALYNPQLGKDWFRAVASNEVTFSRDGRLLLEWVAREKYPVLIGPDPRLYNDLAKAGVPVKVVHTVKEGSFAGSGSSYMLVLDKLPHPNAARVFINWFLDKEGQLIHSKESGFASLRPDVPTEHLLPGSVPTGDYKWMFGEESEGERDETNRFAKELLGG